MDVVPGVVVHCGAGLLVPGMLVVPGMLLVPGVLLVPSVLVVPGLRLLRLGEGVADMLGHGSAGAVVSAVSNPAG
jgi:hypothetical protein